MPSGPKPDSDSELSDDLKDIVMPDGPPPSKVRLGDGQSIPLPFHLSRADRRYRTIDS